MANAWIQYLGAYRKKNPKMSMKMAMKSAAVEYRKQKGTGSKGAGSKKKATGKRGKKKK